MAMATATDTGVMVRMIMVVMIVMMVNVYLCSKGSMILSLR